MLRYDVKSKIAGEFINHKEIMETLAWAEANRDDRELLDGIMRKAGEMKGLNHREASLLLLAGENDEILALAGRIKDVFYGKRVVLFAPLYLSNYCVNGCTYCPYNAGNKDMPRRKLSQDEIRKEVEALQDMGHKRIVIETGEHPVYSPIEYVLESIKTIYGVKHKNGSIRRINVNIAALSGEDYRKLADAGIGTYLLFQETYHKESYKQLHPTGPKSNYEWHTEAMDRAMQNGVEDVGLGVLFGLEKYRYEFAGLLMHAEHLEAAYGVGPHTVSVPRIRPAEGVDAEGFHNSISDEVFARIIACIRIAAPYTGIIVSTRETEECRRKVLDAGVSQISGGSLTSVGGYSEGEKQSTSQFEISDDRSLGEVVSWLIDIGYIPSFCTACYREGRVGDRFMQLCKSGQIQNCCHPNALMTLQEYLLDYADETVRAAGEQLIEKGLAQIPNDKTRKLITGHIEKIKSGSRDFRL